MTPAEKYLAEVEQRLNAATPGPWRTHWLDPEYSPPDAEFITHVHTDLKKLVAALRVAVEALDKVSRRRPVLQSSLDALERIEKILEGE